MTSGKENTNKVFALIANQSYTLSDWPIFNACKELRTSTGNDGWYIPNTTEYVNLFNVVSTINNKITAISGGTEVVIPTKELDASGYWTSKEDQTTTTALMMYYAKGSKNTSKANEHKVRFILDF